MNVSLLRKGYDILIIPLFLLLLLLQSGVLLATPACPIITQSFQNSANGATSDPSATGWYLDASHVPNAVYFAAQSHRLKAQALGGEGVWYSQVFSIAGYTNVQVDAKISSEGTFTSSEYVKVYYKLDGGPETLISAQYGSFGTPTPVSPMLTGSTVQIVIRIYNVTTGPAYYYVENYDVFKQTGPCTVSGISVSASATNSGVLTCNNPSTTLSAGSSAPGVTYSWTGPGGFTGSGSSVSASVPGTYTVTGTSSAGTGSASVTVTANNSVPDLTATGANMACASSVVISASSSVSGAIYTWTGPGGFTGSGSAVSVSAAGTYTVTVKNPATGCTASMPVTVTSGTPAATVYWLEDFTLPNGTTSDAGATPWSATSNGTGTYTYSVQNNEFKTTFTGQKEGVWTSGLIDISAKSNTVVSVDLRSETASSGDAFENTDYVRVYLKINGRADSLIFEDLAGIGNSTTGTVATTVSSAALNGSTLQVIIKTSNSDPTERYYFDNVKLTGVSSAASVTASVTGIVTCNSTAQLSATTTGTATAYTWAGPGGFTSAVQNPTVSAGGQYTVTATLSGGCTASAPVTVPENKTAPDISATGGTLACVSSTAISAGSTVPGAIYSWTGPGGFTGSGSTVTVSVPGNYTATVSNPANGCTASQSVTVSSGVSSLWLEDLTLANGTTSDAGVTKWSVVSTPSGSVFSVQNNEFRVSNTGSAAGSESVWASDTINIAGKTNVSLSASIRSSITGTAVMNKDGAFMDYIRFYYKIDGGSEVLFSETLAAVNNHSTTNTNISVGSLSGNRIQIIVRARATGSDEFYYFDNVQVSGQAGLSATATAGGVLRCNNASVTLNGSSSTLGVTYNWTGPGGFTGSGSTVPVSIPGVYTLTVSSGGCTGTDTANVLQNIDVPAVLSVVSSTGSTVLTCKNSSFALTGSSSTPGVSFNWSGPGGLSVSSPSATITLPGSYVLTAIHPVSGCTSTNTTVVAQNITVPANISTTSVPASGQLDCTASNVMLTGNSSTTGVSYSWSGPDGFSVSSSAATAIKAGTYTLTVTDPANGCSSTATAAVTQNLDPPASVTATPSNQITCAQNSATLTGFSTTDGATYVWTGPNGFTSGLRITSTTVAGPYMLTVTNPANGCTATKPINVQQNKTAPEGVSIDPPEQLNCDVTEITLTGHSTTSNVLYIWSGPNDFSDVAPITTVTDPGDYTLTVVNQTNGCSADAFVTVEQDLTGCEAVARKVSNRTAAGLGDSGPSGLSAGFTFKVYPNPVSNAAFVDLGSPVSARVEVGIYNSMGVREKLLFNGTLEANRGYKLSIDAGSFSMGIHFCIIKVDGKIYSSKLLFTPGRP